MGERLDRFAHAAGFGSHLTRRDLLWESKYMVLYYVLSITSPKPGNRFTSPVSFRKIYSFVLTAVVFGSTALILVTWDAWANKTELLRAVAATRGLLLLVNISTAICWITYFSALKMIELTVAFTIVSGTFPLSIAVLGHLGANGTTAERNLIRTTGNVIVAGALIILAVATLSGNTGLAGPAALDG
jgi:hypothetical protein